MINFNQYINIMKQWLKILVAVVAIYIAFILYEWHDLYNDQGFRPDLDKTKRLTESLAATFLYSTWAIVATIMRVFSGGRVTPE